MLYHYCTCYNCLAEDEPSGSKHLCVEDTLKIKLSLTKVHFVGLRYIILLITFEVVFAKRF
jgi:hypothetical protein